LLLRDGARGRLLDVVSSAALDSLVAQHCGKHRQRLFPPSVTLGLFVEQAMAADTACQGAVGRYLSERTRLGLAANGLGTGSYCKARRRLPLSLIEGCMTEVARIAAQALPMAARWRGRQIKLIDGTGVSMPDTPALQAAFPHSRSQAPGVGFPHALIVGLISLGSGCVTDWTMTPIQGAGNGESSQLWRLLDRLSPGEVLIADRAYGSYFVLAALHQRGIDFVIREPAARKCTPDRAQVLGRGDRLVVWSRPVRPDWMPEAIYEGIPETIQVRQVHDGQRRIVTSLRDPHDVAAAEVAWLYRQRWNIELDFRSIKCAMQMDVLTCRSPDMVRKEVAAHLLAFNLIRVVMGAAAAPEGLQVRQLSFAAARRAAATYQCNVRGNTTVQNRVAARFMLLQQIAYWRIPLRPDRIEPRAIKRRPKPRALLTEPRPQARARIAEQQRALRAGGA
jgi:hypothetical protein